MLGLPIGAPQAKKIERFQPQNHKNGLKWVCGVRFQGVWWSSSLQTGDISGNFSLLERWGYFSKYFRKHRPSPNGCAMIEYAQHLIEHGYTPDQWCHECKCRCAPAVDAIVASMAEGNPRR